MEILNIELVLLSIYTSAISVFFAFCMQKGFIFRKYWNFLVIYLYLDRRWKRLSKVRGLLFAVMGGCIWCTNPYITALACIALNKTPIEWIFAAALNHILIQLWQRLTQER